MEQEHGHALGVEHVWLAGIFFEGDPVQRQRAPGSTLECAMATRRGPFLMAFPLFACQHANLTTRDCKRMTLGDMWTPKKICSRLHTCHGRHRYVSRHTF